MALHLTSIRKKQTLKVIKCCNLFHCNFKGISGWELHPTSQIQTLWLQFNKHQTYLSFKLILTTWERLLLPEMCITQSKCNFHFIWTLVFLWQPCWMWSIFHNYFILIWISIDVLLLQMKTHFLHLFCNFVSYAGRPNSKWPKFSTSSTTVEKNQN